MTDDDFRRQVVTALLRISDALERVSPAPSNIIPRRLEVDDLTQMSRETRDRLRRQWDAHDQQQSFEPPTRP